MSHCAVFGCVALIGACLSTSVAIAQSAYPGLTYGLGAARQTEAQVTLFYPDGTPSRCDSNFSEDDVTLTLNPCRLGWECINALQGAFSGLSTTQPGLRSGGKITLSGPMLLANYAFNVSCSSELDDEGKLLSSARIVPMAEVTTEE